MQYVLITTHSNDSNEVSNNESCKTNMIVRVTLIIIVTPIYAWYPHESMNLPMKAPVFNRRSAAPAQMELQLRLPQHPGLGRPGNHGENVWIAWIAQKKEWFRGIPMCGKPHMCFWIYRFDMIKWCKKNKWTWNRTWNETEEVDLAEPFAWY